MNLFILIVLLTSVQFKSTYSCTEDPQCYYGSKYLFNSVPASGNPISWYEAEERCKANGTHLASIHSWDDIVDSINACKRSKVNDKCWIGLNDINNEGEYKWIDESNYNSSIGNNFGWAIGEPSGNLPEFMDEDCVYISPEKFYRWNDLTCSGEFLYSDIKVFGWLCNNPQYDPSLECLCNCDVCLVQGDPHITTFDGLLYHFMGPCTYLYVTPCFNNYNELPIEISGSHVQCFESQESRTCLQNLYINLYDSNNELAAQLKLGEHYFAQWVNGVGNLGLNGNVNLGEYINWNRNFLNINEKREIYIIRSTTGVLDVQIYWNDTINHQIMDARIQLAENFDPNGWGAYVDIWLASCYAENSDVCGLCGLYDFNSLNDFTYVDAQNNLVTISSADVSIVKSMTLDAWRRTNEFGNAWLNNEITTDDQNCTIIGNPPEQNCSLIVESYCKKFWKEECPCPNDINYFNSTWLEGCIWDTCSLCTQLDWSNTTYEEALLLGCFAFGNITCINNCRPEIVETYAPSFPPTIRPTNRPTPQPTNRPSLNPTPQPTFRPTNRPTEPPTFNLTGAVLEDTTTTSTTTTTTTTTTKSPTVEQYWWHWVNKPTTKRPTYKPTPRPTPRPTFRPTLRPTTPSPTLQGSPQDVSTTQSQDQYWWQWTNNNNNKNNKNKKNGGRH